MDEPSSPEGNAITLRIKFKSASLDDFVARYGADVSAGGIFIRTKQPLAVGTALHFDFTLGDGVPLIAGMGTVVWVREADASRVGSVPGMGVRFDQLTPEGQQTHQQILVAKAKRQERPGTPSPASPAAPPAPFARPYTPPPPAAVRPGTPAPPTAGRPMAPTPVVPPAAFRPVAPAPAAPHKVEDSSSFEDFGSGGKTEIADRPPSFYFDSAGSKPTKAPPARPAPTSAAPTSLLDDAETDSRQVNTSGSGVPSQPVDLGDFSGGLSAPVELLDADSKANESDSAGAPSITDLPLPVDGLALPADGGAAPLSVGKEGSWLDDALKATSDESAVPEAAPNEPTQETSLAPGITVPGTPALLDETALAAGADERRVDDDISETPTEDHGTRGGKSGKTLIIVGSIAACMAFAGVYLWMAKPWEKQGPRSVVPTAAPAAPKEIAPTAPVAEPPAPAAQPVVAEPVKPAEPAKPAVVPAAEKPVEAAADPAKIEPAGESGKRSGASGKKPSAKSAIVPSTLPIAPVPAPSFAAAAARAAGADLVYILKIKSLPVGAHVTMDGDAMGTTPFQRRILDIDKPHTVQVRKPGFDSYERTVTKADFGAPTGNTATLILSPKLTKLRSQPGAPTPSPTPAPAPAAEEPAAPEQPEKL